MDTIDINPQYPNVWYGIIGHDIRYGTVYGLVYDMICCMVYY